MGESRRLEMRFFADFERVLPTAALEAILAQHGPRKRRPPRLSARQLLTGLVYHVSQKSGLLGAPLAELTGEKISEAAASQRRLAMPWEVFAAILPEALVPLADPAQHPEAFYAGRRLVGIDGTQFSCGNTPRILGTMTKAASRRFTAAFAKLGSAVSVELGTHAPPGRRHLRARSGRERDCPGGRTAGAPAPGKPAFGRPAFWRRRVHRPVAGHRSRRAGAGVFVARGQAAQT